MSIRYSNLFVSVSTFILTLLVVMPFSAYAQQNENNKDIVATAKQDAQNNESKFKWMLGGCCLIGTGMAYVAKPTPAKTALSDKSAEYVEIYEQAYESEAKKIRRTGAWIGTGGSVLAIPLAFVGVYLLVALAMSG
jgi:hypothetical protein